MAALRNLVLLAAILAACDDDAPAADDKPVTNQTLTALGTDVAQIRVFDRMLRPVGIKDLAPGLVAASAIKQIQDRLKLDLVDPACVVQTSEPNGLTLRFTGCDYAVNHTLDGTVSLHVEPEAGTCNGDPCITAVVFALEIDGLTLGDTEITSASSSLRVPTDKSPRIYHGEAELTGPDGDHLSTRSDSSWTTSAGCFTADFGLEIATDTREISAAGNAVHVCEANCPDSGEGLIAWASGSTLGWRYIDKGKLVVRGPKGRVFNVTQACANK